MIKDLQLIDCTTRLVRPAADGDRYVALSYVWGEFNAPSNCNTQHVFSSRKLPVALPKVIDDAISVTRNLGYSFLWVDKYCIDQDDANSKHDQIRQMDLIYERAELTIISACGDENDSLAGVSTSRMGTQNNDRPWENQLIMGDRPSTVNPQFAMVHPRLDF
ncbi:heterokaryon incompatibility protein-domain-containing protein [Nemania serpens]|nr:heterokaryon incompatibility protein-domain-containing protein [Nemania serpens]